MARTNARTHTLTDAEYKEFQRLLKAAQTPAKDAPAKKDAPRKSLGKDARKAMRAACKAEALVKMRDQKASVKAAAKKWLKANGYDATHIAAALGL